MTVQLRVSVEKVFVIFALLFGMLYAIITPPFQSVDEANHFLRSYAITEGQIVSTKQNTAVGSVLPASLLELVKKFQYLEKDITKQTSFKEIKKSFSITDNSKNFTTYPNTALYSPVAYIAQSSGILCGKILHTSSLFMFYLTRIFNLILYCILGYYAIKCTPFLKLAVFLILLCPMNISLAASCSTDVTLIGVSLLLFAKILEYSFNDKSLSVKNYTLLGFLLLILALTKHNFYFVPLLFLIPKEKFGTKYILKIAMIILPSIAACLIWSKMIAGLYIPLNPQADMYKQIDFIMNNPIKYIGILIATTFVKAFRLFITSIGVLGWQDTRLDNLTYMIYPVLLGISIIYSDAKNFILQNWKKYLIVFTAVTAYIIITTYLYLAWSKVGANIIEGLNGKYYTPLLFPLFAVIASSINTKSPDKNIYNSVYLFTALILASGAISLLTRFYDIFPYMNYSI